MPSKRGFLPFVALIGLTVHNLSADDAKTRGKRVLIKQSGTLFVTDPDGVNQRRIAENIWAAALSPDGNLVSYADKKGVHVFSLLDSQSVTLARLTRRARRWPGVVAGPEPPGSRCGGPNEELEFVSGIVSAERRRAAQTRPVVGNHQFFTQGEIHCSSDI